MSMFSEHRDRRLQDVPDRPAGSRRGIADGHGRQSVPALVRGRGRRQRPGDVQRGGWMGGLPADGDGEKQVEVPREARHQADQHGGAARFVKSDRVVVRVFVVGRVLVDSHVLVVRLVLVVVVVAQRPRQRDPALTAVVFVSSFEFIFDYIYTNRGRHTKRFGIHMPDEWTEKKIQPGSSGRQSWF